MERSMKRRAAAAAAAFALVTGGAVLAGCGSSSSDTAASTAASDAAAQPPNGVEKLPAKEILTKSQAAAKAASSVTVMGTIAEGGEETSFDLVLGADASEGTFATNGVELSIVLVDGTSYFKVPGDGWATLLGSGGPEGRAAGEEIASQVGGNWLMLPADPESLGDAGGALGPLLATFGSLFQKDAFLETMLTPEGGATVKGTGDVNGTPVVFLEDTTGEGTLAIQTVGDPYAVQVRSGSTEGSGEISFTNWNAPVNVTAPTDVVDIGQLTEGTAAPAK
jgi:hypothetical protein